jgi:hypothetical protein
MVGQTVPPVTRGRKTGSARNSIVDLCPIYFRLTQEYAEAISAGNTPALELAWLALETHAIEHECVIKAKIARV